MQGLCVNTYNWKNEYIQHSGDTSLLKSFQNVVSVEKYIALRSTFLEALDIFLCYGFCWVFSPLPTQVPMPKFCVVKVTFL